MAVVEAFGVPVLGAPAVVETYGAPVIGAPAVVETYGAPVVGAVRVLGGGIEGIGAPGVEVVETIAAAPMAYGTRTYAAAPVSYTIAPVQYAQPYTTAPIYAGGFSSAPFTFTAAAPAATTPAVVPKPTVVKKSPSRCCW